MLFRSKLILYGTITVGLGLISLSLTQSLAMFYGSFLLVAFGAGGCTVVVTMSAVANWFHKKVGIALGVMASGVGASGFFIPLIVWLIDVYGWRTTLIILGLGMWVLGIPLSFVIRDRPEQYGYLPDGESSVEPIPKPEIQGRRVEIGLKEALKNRTFLYLCTTEAIRMIAVAAVIIHVMPYLGSVGVPRATAGIVAGAIPLFSISGRFGLGWLGDVFDNKYVMVWALFLGFGDAGFLLCASDRCCFPLPSPLRSRLWGSNGHQRRNSKGIFWKRFLWQNDRDPHGLRINWRDYRSYLSRVGI